MDNKSFKNVSEFCKKNWAENVQKNRDLCDGIMQNTFIFNMPWDMEAVQEPVHFDNEINWLFNPGRDPEFIWQFNRHRFLINLAQEYKVSGEDKYAIKYKELIVDWIDNVKLKDDITKNKAWRSLEVGLRAATWLNSFNIIKDCDLIDDKFMAKFNQSLEEHKRYLIGVKDEHFYLSNWGVIQNHGLFCIACHFGEVDLKSGALKIAFNKLYRQSQIQVRSDGMQWEQSPMYHTEVLNCFLDAIIFGQRNGVDFPLDFLNTVKNMAYVLIKWIKPNKTQPLLGDSDNTDITDMLSKCAIVFNDGLLKFMASEVLDFESAWTFGLDGINAYNNIICQKPDFTTVFFEDSGNYILRNDWSDSANYLHFINGYTGGGHAHCDKLHFDLSVKGKDILIDCGRYTYVGANPIRHLLKSPAAHNTVTLNKKKFIKNSRDGWAFIKRAQAIKCQCEDSQEFSILRGAHLGYNKILGGGVVARNIIWLKPDIYIIYDEMHTKGINSVQRYYNFAPSCIVDIQDNQVTAKVDDTKVKIHFLDKKPKLKKQAAYYSYQYNLLDKTSRVVERSKGIGRMAKTIVIDGTGEAIVTTKNVTHNGHQISNKDAIAINIKTADNTYDVILTFNEQMKYLRIDENIGASAYITIYKNNKFLASRW